MADVRGRVDAVWRIEGARIIAALTRATGDVGLAEDVAQTAVEEAMRHWPTAGIPRNPAAWLTAVAKRRAIDEWRRRSRDEAHGDAAATDLPPWSDDDAAPLADDLVRLIFTACHPVLSREAQIALTLRIVMGMRPEEIAHLFLVPVATIQQRIVRAKKTIAAARVPFATPEPAEWRERLTGVLSVVYLLFSEGYAASSGDQVLRPQLAREALRLGRTVSAILPREPEAHALVALMEFQSSRFAARVRDDGSAVLLEDQDRTRWDRSAIVRGRAALARADARGRGRGPYALQAAIAQCHALASSTATTDWATIVVLYEALGRLAANPVVDLSRAVAVSMAEGPATALGIVDGIATSGALSGSALIPSVRGELLARLGRTQEAVSELRTASRLVTNERERDVLAAKIARLKSA